MHLHVDYTCAYAEHFVMSLKSIVEHKMRHINVIDLFRQSHFSKSHFSTIVYNMETTGTSTFPSRKIDSKFIAESVMEIQVTSY